MTTNNERVADISKTIVIEKEVYEAVLRNSVKVADLEAENRRLKKVERKKGKLVNENYKLKQLLKECGRRFEVYKKTKPCSEYMIYDLEYLANKIDEVLK